MGEVQYIDCAIFHRKIHVVGPKCNLRIFEMQIANEGWIENKIDACCHCAYCYYSLEQPEAAQVNKLTDVYKLLFEEVEHNRQFFSISI